MEKLLKEKKSSASSAGRRGTSSKNSHNERFCDSSSLSSSDFSNDVGHNNGEVNNSHNESPSSSPYRLTTPTPTRPSNEGRDGALTRDEESKTKTSTSSTLGKTVHAVFTALAATSSNAATFSPSYGGGGASTMGLISEGHDDEAAGGECYSPSSSSSTTPRIMQVEFHPRGCVWNLILRVPLSATMAIGGSDGDSSGVEEDGGGFSNNEGRTSTTTATTTTTTMDAPLVITCCANEADEYVVEIATTDDNNVNSSNSSNSSDADDNLPQEGKQYHCEMKDVVEALEWLQRRILRAIRKEFRISAARGVADDDVGRESCGEMVLPEVVVVPPSLKGKVVRDAHGGRSVGSNEGITAAAYDTATKKNNQTAESNDQHQQTQQSSTTKRFYSYTPASKTRTIPAEINNNTKNSLHKSKGIAKSESIANMTDVTSKEVTSSESDDSHGTVEEDEEEEPNSEAVLSKKLCHVSRSSCSGYRSAATTTGNEDSRFFSNRRQLQQAASNNSRPTQSLPPTTDPLQVLGCTSSSSQEEDPEISPESLKSPVNEQVRPVVESMKGVGLPKSEIHLVRIGLYSRYSARQFFLNSNGDNVISSGSDYDEEVEREHQSMPTRGVNTSVFDGSDLNASERSLNFDYAMNGSSEALTMDVSNRSVCTEEDIRKAHLGLLSHKSMELRGIDRQSIFSSVGSEEGLNGGSVQVWNTMDSSKARLGLLSNLTMHATGMDRQSIYDYIPSEEELENDTARACNVMKAEGRAEGEVRMARKGVMSRNTMIKLKNGSKKDTTGDEQKIDERKVFQNMKGRCSEGELRSARRGIMSAASMIKYGAEAEALRQEILENEKVRRDAMQIEDATSREESASASMKASDGEIRSAKMGIASHKSMDSFRRKGVLKEDLSLPCRASFKDDQSSNDDDDDGSYHITETQIDVDSGDDVSDAKEDTKDTLVFSNHAMKKVEQVDILTEGQYYLGISMLVYMYSHLRETCRMGHTRVSIDDIDVHSCQSQQKLPLNGKYLSSTKTAGSIIRVVVDELDAEDEDDADHALLGGEDREYEKR